MARLPRVNPIGVAQHIIQRGNNRQVCFVTEQDFGAYIGWLKEKVSGVRVNFWL
jgi:putative transposase